MKRLICNGFRSAYALFIQRFLVAVFPPFCIDFAFICADGSQHRHNQLTCCARRVNVLFQRYKRYALFCEIIQRVQQVGQTAADAAEALEINRVTFTHIVKHCLKLRSVCILAACLVREYLVKVGRHCVFLPLRVLVYCADANITDSCHRSFLRRCLFGNDAIITQLFANVNIILRIFVNCSAKIYGYKNPAVSDCS